MVMNEILINTANYGKGLGVDIYGAGSDIRTE